jgi:hypothetical protein
VGVAARTARGVVGQTTHTGVRALVATGWPGELSIWFRCLSLPEQILLLGDARPIERPEANPLDLARHANALVEIERPRA